MFRSLIPILVGFGLLFPGLCLAQTETTVEHGQVPPVLELDEDQRVDLEFSEGTPARDIYLALGREFGIDVLFDVKMRSRETGLVLRDSSPRASLEALAQAAGDFLTVVDEKTILVANDTPQMRRTYEHQVLRSFSLEYAEIKDLFTVLRSLIGLKHLAADMDNNRVIVRDTAVKVELAEVLVEAHDRPRAEIDILVELLRIESRAGKGSASPVEEAAGRISLSSFDAMKKAGSAVVLARAQLSVLGGDTASYQVSEVLVPAGGSTADLQLQLQLSIEARPHLESGDISLEVEASTEAQRVGVGGNPSQRQAEVSFRLEKDQIYLLGDLAVVEGDSGSGRLALALRPTLVTAPESPDLDSHPLWIGSEARIRSVAGARAGGSNGASSASGSKVRGEGLRTPRARYRPSRRSRSTSGASGGAQPPEAPIAAQSLTFLGMISVDGEQKALLRNGPELIGPIAVGEKVGDLVVRAIGAGAVDLAPAGQAGEGSGLTRLPLQE